MNGAMSALVRGLRSSRASAVIVPFIILLCSARSAAAQTWEQEVTNRATVTYTDENGNPGFAEGIATIRVLRSGNLELRKFVDRAVAVANDTLAFTLRWSNQSVGRVTSIVLTDTLTSSLSFVPGSVRSAAAVTTSVTGNVLAFSIAEVPFGASGELSFAVVVTSAGAEVRNSARAAYLIEGSAGSASSDTTVTRTESLAADLRLRKTVDRGSAVVGDTLHYTIHWHNAGAGRAFAPVLVDSLPAQVQFVPASVLPANVTASFAGGVLTLSPGDVAAGDSSSATFAAVVTGGEGVISNSVRGQYRSAGGSATTSSDTARTQLHAPGDLELRKSVDRTLAATGDTLTWTLRWRNPGPGRVTAIQITDSLPAVVTYVGGSAQGSAGGATQSDGRLLQVDIPELAAGDSGSVSFRAVVAAGEGVVANVARATFSTSGTLKSVQSDTVKTTVGSPTLELELEALVDRPLHVGDTLTFRIGLRNSSLLTVRNLVVTDTLPDQLEFLSAVPEAEAHLAGESSSAVLVSSAPGPVGGDVVWRFAAIAPGATLEILLRTVVRSIGTGQITNVATASSIGVASVLTASAGVFAEEAADLKLRLSGSLLEAASGDAIAYTLLLENTGVTTLSDVVVRGRPDAGIRIQPNTVSGAVMGRQGGELVLSVGTLAPGASRTIQYAATLSGARGDALVNSAYATTGSGLRTDTTRALVRIREAAMLTRIVVGKAWLDENGDGRQQSTESPLSHAVVWTSFGETVRADSLGRFTFPDLIAGRHTFRLDPLSVPSGYANVEPVSVRLDGYTSPVVSFALRRDGSTLLSRQDSISAGFLMGGTIVLSRPRFASPRDGAILGTNKTLVRVEGTPGASVKVLRDEGVIAQGTLRGDGVEDFTGIDLAPGPHVLTAVFGGVSGDEQIQINVHVSGDALRAVRADTAVIRAGRPQVLSLRALDRWGIPVANQPYATVSVAGVTLLDGDADRSSVGVQIPVSKSGALLVRVRADSAGPAHLNVTFGRDLSTIDFAVLPEIRSLVLLADGEIGAGAASKSYGAAVARGALGEHTSVTLSYDSRRTRQRGFGGAFDPLGESRYAVLGDASTRQVLGSATTPLALRIERDQGWLLVGDINTRAFGSDNSPGAYSRSLPGMSAFWRGGPLEVSGFGSQVSQQIVQQQLRGNGTSGPYQLGGAIRLGTDRVAIETRDRLNASLVLSRQDLERFVDYDIDATTGSILLRRPLLSTDASGNPLMLVALAERTDGESAFVGGLRAQLTATPFGARDSLSIGGAYIEDQSPLGGHKLISADIGAGTRWGGSRLEIARGETTDSAGTALRAGAWLGSRAGTGATLEWMRVGDGFANPANPRLIAGTEDMRASAQLTLGRGVSLSSGFTRQWFRQQGAEREQASVGVSHTSGNRKLALDVGLLDERLERDSTATHQESLTSRLTYTFGRNSAWLEAQRELNNDGAMERPDLFGFGASYDLGFGIKAEAAQRFFRGDSASGSMSTVGLRSELSTGTRAWSEYQLGNSEDGRRSAALLGIGQKLQLSSVWAVDAQYERREGLSDLPETDVSRALPFLQMERDRWAASLGLAWTPKSLKARASLRGELSDGEEMGRGYRIFGSGEAVLSPSWTVLLRQDARESERRLTDGTTRTRALQSIVAAAFRPTERSDWNGLVKLEYRNDENPLRNAGAILNGTDERIIGAVEGVWTPRTGTELGVRYALRHAQQGGLLAGGADITAYTQYSGVRARRQLTERFDLRGSARLLFEQGSDLVRWDAAPALGVQLLRGLELEAGYRFGDLRDADFAQNGGSGLYASLGMSLTEASGASLADFWRSRITRSGN